MLRIRTAISCGTPVRWPAWSTLLRLQGFCSDITTTERRRDACSSFFSCIKSAAQNIFLKLNTNQIIDCLVESHFLTTYMYTPQRGLTPWHPFLAEHQARLTYLQTFKPSYQLFLINRPRRSLGIQLCWRDHSWTYLSPWKPQWTVSKISRVNVRPKGSCTVGLLRTLREAIFQ